MVKNMKQIQNDFPVQKKRRSKRQLVYTCTFCWYESSRPYNVRRHEERIHCNTKLRYCCGQKFYTKGNYYIHCEKYHPARRTSTITTKKKYKITSDSVPTMQPVYIKGFKDVWSRDQSNSCEWQFERRTSQRILEKRLLSPMSLTYKFTYSDIENIPLIRFLTDRQLRHYMKRLSAQSLLNRIGEKTDEDAKQTVNNITISPDQDVEKSATKNIAEKTSDCCGLPAKKLLLHRFRENVPRKLEIPFREQNNNNSSQVNFEEATTKESLSVRQNWSKNCKRSSYKENMSTFAFSFEQQLKVNLDKKIAGSVLTELHRDFLAAIDFDKNNIF